MDLPTLGRPTIATRGFAMFITPYLNKGKAKIAVSVDNSESKEVYPQTADFTFYGGLYRDVNLVIVNKTHFDLDYYGGNGVAVTPVVNEDGSATVKVETFVTGNADNYDIVVETARLVPGVHFYMATDEAGYKKTGKLLVK